MKLRTERTVIAVETFQRTVIRTGRPSKTAWCRECGKDVQIYTAQSRRYRGMARRYGFRTRRWHSMPFDKDRDR